MAKQPYKDSGIWHHSDGTQYRNQALAESDAQFRLDSDDLREAHKADSGLNTGEVTIVPGQSERESATIQVTGR